MCLTCGCGEPHKEMGEDNITYDDIKRAADANNMTIADTLTKLQVAADVEGKEQRQTNPMQGLIPASARCRAESAPVASPRPARRVCLPSPPTG
jgi:hypothetical protein